MSEMSKVLKQKKSLPTKLKNLVAAFVMVASLTAADITPVFAAGETRTISLQHIHTGESLSVTYMKGGRYVPSAMRQINYLMRDWRKNQTITIDPRTIDLMWELHADLGSRSTIKIVCGYRSPATNKFLKRIGRNVARESTHTRGKAIDFYFPDVPTKKIRNSALVRKIGGVGYYRSAGGPTGFLHVDTGNVRHWGPFISKGEMAQIFRDGRKYLGRRTRLNGGNQSGTVVASNEEGQAPRGFLSKLLGIGNEGANAAPSKAERAAIEKANGELASLSKEIAAKPEKLEKPAAKLKPTAATKVSEEQMETLADLAKASAKKQKAAEDKALEDKAVADADLIAAADAANLAEIVDSAADNPELDVPENMVSKGRIIPKPRLKPMEIMVMAAANMKPAPQVIRITAASTAPEGVIAPEANSPVADSLSTLMEEAAATEQAVENPSKPALKLKPLLLTKKVKKPVLKPRIASNNDNDINWWPQLVLREDIAADPTLADEKQDLVVNTAEKTDLDL